LAQLTESIREIRETLQENGKWRAESAKRQAEDDKRRAEDDKRRAEEYNQKFAQLVEQTKDTDRRMKETDKRLGGLGDRVGQIVENMVYGDIVSQFRELGYKVTKTIRNIEFGIDGTGYAGEVGVLLDDGVVAILIEAKTTLKKDHILEHIEQLEKYRRYIDSSGSGEKRRYVGAVAGAVVANNVIEFAHANGLYVIVQSARDVKIVETPEGFKAKEW